MKQKRSAVFWRSFYISLMLCMACIGLFLGCCAVWEGIQAVAAEQVPAITLLADGRLRVLDWYISF